MPRASAASLLTLAAAGAAGAARAQNPNATVVPCGGFVAWQSVVVSPP